MAKKQIKSKKSNGNRKKKEKILEELASKLREDMFDKEKKIQKQDKSESDIENFEFENSDFENFRTNFSVSELSEKSSPVLERIAGSQGNPIFVNTISQNSGIDFNDENKRKKSNSEYIATSAEDNQPKYSSQYTESSISPERMDLSKVGRKTSEFVQENPGAFFRQPSENSGWNSSKDELWGGERINTESAGRKNPLELQEEKYKIYKSKESTGTGH